MPTPDVLQRDPASFSDQDAFYTMIDQHELDAAKLEAENMKAAIAAGVVEQERSSTISES